jgi:hypothetical protein
MSLLAQRVLATVQGDMVGSAGVGGYGNGSGARLLLGDSLDMLIEVGKDMSQWFRVEGWGQEHLNCSWRWTRQRSPGGGVLAGLQELR